MLKERVGWFRGPTRHNRELSLADAYLKRSDYLRAATFMYEAFVTRACYDQRRNPNDASERDEAYESARKKTPEVGELKKLRNALAYGVRTSDERAQKDTNDTIDDEKRLRRALDVLRNKLF